MHDRRASGSTAGSLVLQPIGRDADPARTNDQVRVAQYWENLTGSYAAGAWNVLARQAMAQRGFDEARTARTLATMHLRAHRGERKHRHGLQLSQSDVTAIRERLERLSPRRRRKIRGLKAERADIILAGAIVIEELMIFGGYLTLLVCTRGVRDGILLHETFATRGSG